MVKISNIKLINVSKGKKDLIISSGLLKLYIQYYENTKKYKKIKREKTKIHLNYWKNYQTGLHLLIQALNDVKLNDIF